MSSKLQNNDTKKEYVDVDNIKPVAWMSPDGKFSTTEGKLFYIPLYTAPRELSDEEILNVAFCCEVNTVAIENDWDGTVIDFAKAILKKASER